MRRSLPRAGAETIICARSPASIENQALVVAVPRLVYRLHRGGDAPDWGDTALQLPEADRWEDVFTGRTYPADRVRASELLADFPVSVLLRR